LGGFVDFSGSFWSKRAEACQCFPSHFLW